MTYRTSAGVIRHVYVWGAINADPPDPDSQQVHFQLRLLGRAREGRPPDLADVPEPLPPVRRAEARLARGGLQGAGRLLLGAPAVAAPVADARRRTVPPRAGVVRAPRLALVGPAARARGVAELDLRRQVAGAVRPAHAISVNPVFGFRTPSSHRRDSYARFFYVDTFNSVFGAGWKHDAGKVAHSRNGAFCYSFVPQLTPPGYPTRELRPPATASVTASR